MDLPYISRGVAQPGRAPAWGAGGRQFKSGHPDHLTPKEQCPNIPEEGALRDIVPVSA